MNMGEQIKTAREGLGLTQEDLAERCSVSRQAVSKWELGASLPAPENLALLEDILGVRLAPEEAPASRKIAPGYWRAAAIALGALLLAGLLSILLFLTLRPGPGDLEPAITEVAFFDEDANPLAPDLGDGWYSFAPGSRVLVAVRFRNGASVSAVSLFLTPTGTETFDLREQTGVQAVADGRDFALFAWDIPRDLMGHLDVTLECTGGRVVETLNVTAPA